MKNLQVNFNKLQQKLGIDGAIKEVQKMINRQGITTLDELNDALEEELMLQEVD